MLLEKYQHDGDIGERQAFDHHECDDSRARLYVTRTSTGYIHHCHNCAPLMSGFTAKEGEVSPSSLRAALQKRQETAAAKAEGKIVLPWDFTLDIPQRQQLWLERWLTTDEVKSNGIGYSHDMSRIIFPVYDMEGGLMYWQGRNTEGVKPKYKNVRATGKSIFYASGDLESASVVLVEAIISSIVVGRSQHAVALLGAYIDQSTVRFLRRYEQVYVWLDPDKAAESIRMALHISRSIGIPCRPLLTKLKPKEYSVEEVEKILLDKCIQT